ncbi:MAG: 4Fe-4S dicluster domain-containing protein [Flavonifractor plautii]
MGYSLNAAQAEAVLQALKQNYSVYAPKRFPKQGRYSDTDVIKYAEVEHYEDIVWQVKSDYPAKEVLTPIQQAVFYFTEDEYRASKGPKKPILILARPCDINAQHVQAKIYAGNGGYTDLYYERMREKVKFALMECNGGDDTCFCVSMGTNKTDDYSLALKFSDEGVRVQVTDETFAPYFEGMPQADYTPAFVEENELKVTVPIWTTRRCAWPRSHPSGRSLTAAASPAAPVPWPAPPAPASPPRRHLRRDNPEVGERRRVTASCQIAGFDQMAGQREVPLHCRRADALQGAPQVPRLQGPLRRGHMCVGCGRCTHRCPELISISATVNKVNAAVNEIRPAWPSSKKENEMTNRFSLRPVKS